jgi:hypothetical protein
MRVDSWCILEPMDRRALLRVIPLLASIPFIGGFKPTAPKAFELTPEEKVSLISSIKFEDGKEDGFEHGSLLGEVTIHQGLGNITVWVQFPKELNDPKHMIRAVEAYVQTRYDQSIPMDVCIVHAYDPRVGAIFPPRSTQWNELSRMYERRPSVW